MGICKRLGWLAVLAVAFVAWGQAGKTGLPAPLFDGLGSLHHEVTTSSKDAQRFFDQGLMLCYAFNHREAIRSFRAAAELDPQCAMAWWGVAYASGPHVNRPMTKEDNQAAWEAVQKALEGRKQVGTREQEYINAMARRYSAEYAEDRSGLDKAYAAAMREVVKACPDDLDAQTLLAEALMDTMPWDYWMKDRSPKPETEEALAALRYVLKNDPDHPGANHFYIHAVEAGPAPGLGLPSADRLAGYAPQAGHLVHMPSHIYIRVGQYRDAVEANERAVKADRSYVQSCAAQGFYPGVYYPHNMHFLWFATMFEGRSAESLREAEKVVRYAGDNICGGPTTVVEAPRFRHLPWLTLARFGKWDQVLAVPEPPGTNTFLVDRIMWHYTRGLAFVAKGQEKEAGRELAQLQTLVEGKELKSLDNPQFPASGTMQVPARLLAGKVAGLRGDTAGMLKELQAAVAAEDALPYMEPAFWPVPTRPTLGAAWLRAGEPEKAEAVFREDLDRLPRNGWGLLGLEESLKRQGKKDAARLVNRQYQDAWKYADIPLQLAWF